MMEVDKALCFRAHIDISKPLQLVINVMITKKPIWFWFKFIKRPDFCYGCGKLGHVLKGYKTIKAEEGEPNLQYGAWLRASPLESRRCSAEYWLLEGEKTIFGLLQVEGSTKGSYKTYI